MNNTTYQQLIAAGAPELPDELFYRIKKDIRSRKMIWVELRKRQIVGSTRLTRSFLDLRDYIQTDESGTVAFTHFYTYPFDPAPAESITELLAARCKKAFKRYKDDQVARRLGKNLTNEINSLLGDHP